MRLKRTIFSKFFLTYLLSSLAAFIIFSACFYFIYQNDLKQEFINSMDLQRKQVEQTLHLAYKNKDEKETILSTLEYINDRNHRSIYLYDRQGQLIYDFSSLKEPLPIKEEIIDHALKGNSTNEHYKINGKPIFLMVSPLENTMYEEKVVVIALHGYDQIINDFKKVFLLAGLITTIVTAAFLYLISKRVTLPLRDMNNIAKEYAKGNFEKRVSVVSNDEIGELGETFNQMAVELASVDNMRKEFVANVSHDLRSPLTSLNGFVCALLDGTIPKEKQSYYLHLMKDETERLIKLVNDLLDVARIEAGQVSIDPTSYNISEQIRMLLAKMEPELVKKDLEIVLDSNGEEDVDVFADPDRIDQVLGNLIQNAVNFSDVKGRINIGIFTRNDHVEVTIQDFGPGIQVEQLENIWDRFFKVDKARSRKVGTGIGLSIAKHIIDLHGAKINVSSTVGEGTTFTIKLPIEERK